MIAIEFDAPSQEITSMTYPKEFYINHKALLAADTPIIDIFCGDGKVVSVYLKRSPEDREIPCQDPADD